MLELNQRHSRNALLPQNNNAVCFLNFAFKYFSSYLLFKAATSSGLAKAPPSVMAEE